MRGGDSSHAEDSAADASETQRTGGSKEREASLKREYAWCVVQVSNYPHNSVRVLVMQVRLRRFTGELSVRAVVQVDRTNFKLRNALWGEADGPIHANLVLQ